MGFEWLKYKPRQLSDHILRYNDLSFALANKGTPFLSNHNQKQFEYERHLSPDKQKQAFVSLDQGT